ncbi:uncharacterized protein EDB91DRAFT_1251820 [Suillus paluster]|uniref:uncharacterized protein n=1 Tax=Suillus paluster TaxID=48578 RepID=UPI001B88116F|nr:uncharacterized protein EDB91DRAFT_1251820 [Suillus paluster]KAG1732180.1 hypothetical protein EDB91DRAFT_1251820 [Suillus paluster]
MSQHHVPEDIEVMESSSTAGFDSDSDNLSSDSDKALMKFCAAVVSLWDNALIADLHKALETAQKLLLNMQGQQWEFLKQNVLLETSAAKGQKRLTCNELELAINSQIFPLRACPNIDINSKERWLSLLSIEDGVKAELFLFIPEADREMMNHKHFSSHVSAVDVLSFETLSDFFNIKTCARAIFGLNPEFFL